jgi:hypothetical protein
MKTLSLKILGCAAALALLTTTRAQTADDVQTVPPPDTNVPPPETSAQQADTQPNVIVVPMPTEALDTNADAGLNGSAGGAPNLQPMQNGQPGQPGQLNQFRGSSNSNQYQGGRNFDRNNNDRNSRRYGRDSGQQRVTAGTSDPGTFMPPANSGTNGSDGLILNFRGAQIDQVLNYLSDAAGFIIELDTRVSGTVDVFSAHPVSKDEAVQLLNSVLNKNGYAAIREGRRLRIMTKDNAMRGQIPVIIGNDPANIPMNDEIVTQIIPIRYVQARQLIIDLSSLTQSPSIIANDAGNSIIVTDTQANIHHLVELVKAIDGSAEDVTVVKPFHLQYHDPVEVANLITSVYADQSNGQGGGQAPIRFGGGGGFGGFGGFGGRGGQGGGGLRALFGGGQGGGGQQGGQAVRQKAKVVAVADQRMASVIVTAPKDLMPQIEELVTEIDQESPKVAKVSVIHLENADPIQVQKVLQQFQGNNSRTAQTTQNSPLMTRENQTSSSSSTGFGTTGFGGGTGGGGGFGGGGGGGFGGGGFRGGGQ